METDIWVTLLLDYGRVVPHSGSAVKHFIDIGADVIDEDYKGNAIVLFHLDKSLKSKR